MHAKFAKQIGEKKSLLDKFTGGAILCIRFANILLSELLNPKERKLPPLLDECYVFGVLQHRRLMSFSIPLTLLTKV
jgi:hypothetical protein